MSGRANDHTQTHLEAWGIDPGKVPREGPFDEVTYPQFTTDKDIVRVPWPEGHDFKDFLFCLWKDGLIGEVLVYPHPEEGTC